MNSRDRLQASSAILKTAKEFGASLCGYADVETLKKAPSFTFAPRMPGVGTGVGTRESAHGLQPGEVAWPANAMTVLVIAVHHPADQPEMDWWFGKVDPPGNRILSDIIRRLCDWITQTYDIGVTHLPYHVEKGGTYLKDAAVLAGLGCIGKNNILITPELGPRVRLRALTLDAAFPSTGPSGFNPCEDCGEWCRKACPRKAFDEPMYLSQDYGQDLLPGRDGTYSRPSCNNQMDKDIADAEENQVDGFDTPIKVIKYCRNCELACPVGKL